MVPPWSLLGIAPTADPRAIRRAYAVQLKAIGGDADAFMALRAAYEDALAGASSMPATLSSPTPSPTPSSSPANPIARLLDDGAVEGAAASLVAAQAESALSLGDEMALRDRLLHALGADRALPTASVRGAAAHMGWPDDRDRDPAHRALSDRLAAAAWLEQLQRSAAWWRVLAGFRRSRAARLLLGRGSTSWVWLDPPGPALRSVLAAFARHERWAGAVLDPARIEFLRRTAVTWRDPSGVGWVLAAGLVVFAAVLALTRDFGLAAGLAIVLPPALRYRWQMFGLSLLVAAAVWLNN